MRLFVAVELDDGARRAISVEQERLKAKIGAAGRSLKWVKPDLIHLTLHFIGEVNDEIGAHVVDVMRRPLPLAPFNVSFGGLGAFPIRGAPHVLWLGVIVGVKEIELTRQLVAQRLEEGGMGVGDQKQHPHLTLGRWRTSKPTDRRRVLEKYSPVEIAQIDVNRIALIQSRLSSSGPSYTTLCHAALGQRRTPTTI